MGDRVGLLGAFLLAACCYWLRVFPDVQHQLSHWRERAATIPNPELRGLALATYRGKWSNVEGAAAFATLAPAAHRHIATRALVTFQAAYDYADSVSERPSGDPVANSHLLHRPLVDSLTGDHPPEPDYYEYSDVKDDGGYLKALVKACHRAFLELPAHEVIRVAVTQAAEKIVIYQSLHHGGKAAQSRLAAWSKAETPLGTDLRWHETSAACASSLTALVLLAAAADPRLGPADVHALEHAYHPWVGALHTLLDSLVDWEEDERAGQPSLLDHYRAEAELTDRLKMLAVRSREAVEALPQHHLHSAILAGMMSVYLAGQDAEKGPSGRVSNALRDAIGPLGGASLRVIRLRHAARRARAAFD